MCANIGGSYTPPECITFRTIRRALVELRRGVVSSCHCAYCHYASMPHRRAPGLTSCQAGDIAHDRQVAVRLAYVVGQLRARDNLDCDKAADFLLELFTGDRHDEA